MSSSHVADVQRALSLSRRLDWRFLLPDPGLGRVGFIGPTTGTLLPALRTFSDSVEQVSGGAAAPQAPALDLVVIADPSLAAMDLAARRLRPGGFVYAEVTRTLPARLMARRSPARLAAAARRGGFVDVTTHWHWPTFGAGTRIVPLDDATALEFVVTRGRRHRRARVLAALARLAVSSRLIERGVACISVIGRVPDR
jgi:hypothetical protein